MSLTDYIAILFIAPLAMWAWMRWAPPVVREAK